MSAPRTTDTGWIDVSAHVAPGVTPTWPGSPAIGFERRLDIARGDVATDTTLTMSVHTGTHIDAPAHFVAGGRTVEQLDLSALVGPAYVADLRGVDPITAAALDAAGIPADTERLLLLTDSSAPWEPEFREDFPALSVDGAHWIVARGMRCVGIDYLSVQPYHGSDEVHLSLLGAGIVLVEGLRLGAVRPGRCEFVCLPLLLVGCEGSPARALVRPVD